MSTSKTYQQSLADAGSETRPPMLERGSYIPWASRFRRYINRKRENQKWLNKALDEGPYQFQMFVPTGSTLPTLQTAEDLQGDELLHYDAGPSYDSAFISEVQSSSINKNKEQMYPIHTKIINSTIGDDQIDSNIIFDKPNGNVNSGSVEKDTHVLDLYVLEKLARNAYKEAEKQQLFAQKV
ncbi:hypothetical protein Tco_0861760 [Tanacetum coccineum]